MRVLAFVMIGLVVLSAAFVGYGLWAAALGVGTVQVSVLPASQAGQMFESLKLDGQMDAIKGIIYQDASNMGDASEYVFHVYDAQVKNRGFLAAEWVELTAAQGDGAILQETQETPPDIAGFSESSIRTVVLARAGSTPSTSVALTYFVFGRPYSLPLTAELTATQATSGGEFQPQDNAVYATPETIPTEETQAQPEAPVEQLPDTQQQASPSSGGVYMP